MISTRAAGVPFMVMLVQPRDAAEVDHAASVAVGRITA
jgi:hypothetical protein